MGAARLRAPRGWRGLFAAAVAGAAAALGQAPWDLPLIAVFGVAVMLLWTAGAPDAKRAAAISWSFGAGYFGFALHWIVFPFLVEPEVHGWMAPFAFVFMAGGLALFWAAAGALGHWITRGAGGVRSIAGIALILALAEVARSVLFTGFPWALLGHIWIDSGVAAVSAFVGPYGLTVLTLILSGFLAVSAQGRVYTGLLAATSVAVVAVLVPLPEPVKPPENAPVVRLVQPNVPQAEKWDPDQAREFYARLIVATGAGTPPDLIVWPESSLPFLMRYAQDAFDRIALAARGAPVVLGINRDDGQRYFNSLAMIDGAGGVEATYDKRHLVPFGEYIPFGDVLGRLGLRGLAQSEGSGFSEGSGAAAITLPSGQVMLPLICYEGIFAGDVAAAVRKERPDVIVLITNDGWFGPGAGPRQHLAQARLRAIETGLPMVRVANTGISAMIDPAGRITASLEMDVDGWIDAELTGPLPPTAYVRFGDWPVLLLLGVALGAALAARARNPIDRAATPD